MCYTAKAGVSDVVNNADAAGLVLHLKLVTVLFYFIVLTCCMCRCMKWIQNMRRDDLRGKPPEYLYKNCRLCSQHFEDSQFYCGATKDRLLPHAVPTLFNVPNPPAPLCTQRRVLRRSAEVSAETRSKHPRAIGNLLVRFMYMLDNRCLPSS